MSRLTTREEHAPSAVPVHVSTDRSLTPSSVLRGDSGLHQIGVECRGRLRVTARKWHDLRLLVASKTAMAPDKGQCSRFQSDRESMHRALDAVSGASSAACRVGIRLEGRDFEVVITLRRKSASNTPIGALGPRHAE